MAQPRGPVRRRLEGGAAPDLSSGLPAAWGPETDRTEIARASWSGVIMLGERRPWMPRHSLRRGT